MDIFILSSNELSARKNCEVYMSLFLITCFIHFNSLLVILMMLLIVSLDTIWITRNLDLKQWHVYFKNSSCQYLIRTQNEHLNELKIVSCRNSWQLQWWICTDGSYHATVCRPNVHKFHGVIGMFWPKTKVGNPGSAPNSLVQRLGFFCSFDRSFNKKNTICWSESILSSVAFIH